MAWPSFQNSGAHLGAACGCRLQSIRRLFPSHFHLLFLISSIMLYCIYYKRYHFHWNSFPLDDISCLSADLSKITSGSKLAEVSSCISDVFLSICFLITTAIPLHDHFNLFNIKATVKQICYKYSETWKRRPPLGPKMCGLH